MSTLRTIMSSDVVTVDPAMTVLEAVDAMLAHHVSSAPVLRRGRVVGAVSSDDLMLLVPRVGRAGQGSREPRPEAVAGELETATAASPPGGGPENRSPAAARRLIEHEVDVPVSTILERVLVEDVMRPTSCSLPPEANVGAAAALMHRAGDRHVLVMEGDRLFGIVYEGDFARAVAADDPPA